MELRDPAADPSFEDFWVYPEIDVITLSFSRPFLLILDFVFFILYP